MSASLSLERNHTLSSLCLRASTGDFIFRILSFRGDQFTFKSFIVSSRAGLFEVGLR